MADLMQNSSGFFENNPAMAQLMTVNLSRMDASPWGFRLQGGKDFGQPLIVQKVNAGSLAEKAGLRPGDSLIKINNVELFDLAHKDAQNAIVRGGNSFELTIQRGGSTWKPSVVPVGPTPKPNPGANYIQPVTKTSLAHTPQAPLPSFSQYNYAPKPFGGPHMNGMSGDRNPNLKNLASKQYNSPIGLYSDQAIAETLSAQAEVLAGGVVGVNFMKNEKAYNAHNSEVLKMVQEIDNEPREPEPARASSYPYYTTANHSVDVGGVGRWITPGSIPSPQNVYSRSIRKPSEPSDLPQAQVSSQSPICNECERCIIGLFVRIKDKNLHVDCFKCATCGTSLKNVGYYNINNKLYCDIHAKMVARQNPPAVNLEPLIVPPGSKLPPSIVSSCKGTVPPAFQSEFSNSTNPGSPQPGNLGPVPYQPFAGTQIPKINVTQPGGPSPLTRPQSGRGSPGPWRPKNGTFAGASSPKRGKGIMNPPNSSRIPLCANCNGHIRGPFITALGKIWCPDHFVCSNVQCKRPLIDIGFVEEKEQLYCEFCFEKYIAPDCDKCHGKIKGDCLNAIGKHFHPECFACEHCGKLFRNDPFFMEDGQPYCQADWNQFFTTKCFSCGFPIEAGDKWIEALNNNYHSQCFNCTTCKSSLEGQTFFAKGGRAFCKSHAR